MYGLVIFLCFIPYEGQAVYGDSCAGLCAEGTYCSKPENYCKCQRGFIHRKEFNGTFTCLTVGFEPAPHRWKVCVGLRDDHSNPLDHRGPFSPLENPTKDSQAQSETISTDIDECKFQIFDCPVNSTCINTYGSYYCQCQTGLYKTVQGYCKPDVNECSLGIAECQPNSYCQNSLGSYFCTCSKGFQLSSNGTCIPQTGGGVLAWYWWVGIAILGFVVLCIIIRIIKCCCCSSDDDSDMGDTISEKNVEIMKIEIYPEEETKLKSLLEEEIQMDDAKKNTPNSPLLGNILTYSKTSLTESSTGCDDFLNGDVHQPSLSSQDYKITMHPSPQTTKKSYLTM